MKRRDVKVGARVYHTVFTHWGSGVVQGIVRANAMEALFERGAYRAVVHFAAHTESVRTILPHLRKTPNRKKIRDMVAMYRKRGVDAQDGGDRLILPTDEVPA